MDIQLLTEFFKWCTILNVVILAVSTLLFLFAADFAYSIHSKWFSISKEAFNIVLYSFLGVYKVLVIVFNFIPWIVLLMIG